MFIQIFKVNSQKIFFDGKNRSKTQKNAKNGEKTANVAGSMAY
jgi:hypothetical protein